MGDEHVTTVSYAAASSMVTMRNTVEGDDIDVLKAQVSFAKKVANRIPAHHIVQRKRWVITQVCARTAWRSPAIMLLAIKTLLLNSGDHLTVDHERGAVMLTGRDCET